MKTPHSFFSMMLYRDMLYMVLGGGILYLIVSVFSDAAMWGMFIMPFALGTSSDGGGSTGCSGCSGGGDSGDTGGTTFSTPFLCTWNGERHVFENDFLLGNPSTFYLDQKKGREAYLAGETGPDLYKIQNRLESRNGKISLQIKEIEPEESFVGHISLTRVCVPESSMLAVNSRHHTFHVFDHQDMERNGHVLEQCTFVRGEKISSNKWGTAARFINGDLRQHEYRLDVGDVLEIEGRVEKAERLFLLVGSRYRDWTAGNMAGQQSALSLRRRTSSPYALLMTSPKMIMQTLGLLILASAVWVAGAVGSAGSKLIRNEHSAQDDARMLAEAFGVSRAHADTPHSGGHSLIVESFWDWERGEFHRAEVVHPRHNQHSVDAIELPVDRAVGPNGEVRVRITATKTHYVSAASLFVPTKELAYKEEGLQLSRVYHHRLGKDVANDVCKKNDGKFLHTIAGDVVDVEFDVAQEPTPEGMRSEYLFAAEGFYTPLNEDGAVKAGNWTERLDEEARALLNEMQPNLIVT